MKKVDKMQNELEKNIEEVNCSGWDAIDNECSRVYHDQKNPKHYAPIIKWNLGGNSPLDGISVYDGGDYWHFVTYGLSELYEKETDDLEYSGFGMEFTFKLKKDNYENEELEISCICGILQSIARITFNNREIFKPYEYLYTGQKDGIDVNRKSNITGFITIFDDKFQSLNTPNGKVDFVCFIGVTKEEIEAVKNKEITVKELYKKLDSNITDYNRKSVINNDK
ncbi:MAG: suppressor of fused domain protein [Bacilli bacterium]|nr:suppressor of fused domain protein [Bacilli bacterium]